MNINIICVGKIKEKYFRDAIDEFAKRLGRFAAFKVIELPDRKIPDNASPAEQKAVIEAEGADILKALGKGYTIALCVEGKELSSEEWAAKTEDILRENSTINYVIGGSLGLSDEVKRRADFRLSLGRITLPHRIARLVLAEQIYRCFKINANETYHK
ncbi:MAG: 23S rRNA (pseudouridine(1915)-N(3))-methyltransferase RlmH [Oscillospiraceae bacterium]|nr:23S rRNA (pseudouridine(1915)-N(3))-methyltransferase RlmH [Oscillospiraceae bacterium]